MWSLGTFVIRQQPSSQKGAILAGYYAAAAFTLGLDNRRAVPVAATCRAIILNACDCSDSAGNGDSSCCQLVAIDVLASVGRNIFRSFRGKSVMKVRLPRISACPTLTDPSPTSPQPLPTSDFGIINTQSSIPTLT